MKNFFISLFCLFNCCVACAQNDLSNWETFNGDEYTINYPENWDINDSGYMGTDFIIISPLTGQFDDFRENINLIKIETQGNYSSLKQFVEINISSILALMNNSKIVESVQLDKNKQPYHKLIYTFPDNALNLTVLQYYWLIDDIGYILSFTSKEETFEEYKIIGYGILDSFKIK